MVINITLFDSVLLLVITILVIYIINNYIKEDYVSKKEKANVIYNWFSKNSHPKYTNYKSDISDSDIVEYTDIKKLYDNKKLSIKNILKFI